MTTPTMALRDAKSIDGVQRTAGSSGLSHLESVLRQLSKHEEHAQKQHVERTSIQTQQRLLKDQILQLQDELVAAQEAKAKLCETIGALQQTKASQEKELVELRSELCASRENQTALARKVEALELKTCELKRGYTRSLEYRTITTNELLAKLHLRGVFSELNETCQQLESKALDWVETKDTKRKRPMAERPERGRTCGDAESDRTRQDKATNTASDLEVAPSCTANEKSKEEAGLLRRSTNVECSGCKKAAQTAAENVASMQTELQHSRDKIREFEGELKAVREQYQLVQEDYKAAVHRVEDQSKSLVTMQMELDEMREKCKQTPAPESTTTAQVEEPSPSQLKMLEDNLAQLNTYADHLEMVISQCPSCSVKLQSDATQDAVPKE